MIEISSLDAPQQRQGSQAMSRGYVVRLMQLDKLRPHEEHDRDSALHLSRAIAANGYKFKPVLVEERTLTLLDGHHRVAALAILGCKLVPSVLVNYEDPRVNLDGWRPDVVVDRRIVLAAAWCGHLLPIKTTRHQINPDLDQVEVELAMLNVD